MGKLAGWLRGACTMSKYWAMPLVGGIAFLFAFIWDFADGADDVPPWVIETGEQHE